MSPQTGALLRPEPVRSGRPGLLELLMGAVRAEFRQEVFRPEPDSGVFVQGKCVIVSCPRMISQRARGLCEPHYARWHEASQRPDYSDFPAWARNAEGRLVQTNAPASCLVSGCNRARIARGLCSRHQQAWTYAGRPDRVSWTASMAYRPSRAPERDCVWPACPRWREGPSIPFCGIHAGRWRTAGRPDPHDWFEAREARHAESVSLAELGSQARLEVQYGLQRRHDIGLKATPPWKVRRAVLVIARSEARSLLDLDEDQWRDACHGPNGGLNRSASQFIRDTRTELQRLLASDDPWSDQYPRDVWDLQVLGLAGPGIRHLRFTGIEPPWLHEAAKRWCRWRFGCSRSVKTIGNGLAAVTNFSRHLVIAVGPDCRPQDLTRERVESWLAACAASPAIGRDRISAIAVFLRDLQRHGWEPDVPPNAMIYDNDAPKQAPSRPRWIPEHLMRQLEAPDNLAQFPADDGRLILQLLINCGLRLGDARRLPIDCVVRDNTGAPYLAWINYKLGRRTAFFPLSDTLADRIGEQRHRVQQRFPQGSPWLFPRLHQNLNGSRPITDDYLRDHLDDWLQQIRLVDEHGQPARVTPHQFRHTVGTRLINANVPQHVVQQLLDHMSPEMTAVYARLHNTTVRDHWERATKLNADGQPAAIPTEHPLADAAWTRLAMVRAKVTLPNGYCGAPVQTDCEFANPCLDCRFFITTADFLDQHRRQRAETVTFIEQAEQAGIQRLVDRNHRTLTKLDTLISALEQATEPGQIVVAGKVEDLDATG